MIARRYEVAAIVGAAIILIPWARRVPLPIYALIQAGFGLYFTFSAPAAALFFVAVALALFAKRASVTWMPVLVTVFAGTFAYNNPLGFLGSVVFFGALLSAILEEAPDGRGYFNVRNPIHGAAMARG